jgi:hypothetical protein
VLWTRWSCRRSIGAVMQLFRAAGGLAVAASGCLLLFAGAASARQASDSIVVTGVRNGTGIKFTGTVTGSALKTISLSGGSNFTFNSISSPGGNCNLTPTNGGGFCNFVTPQTSVTVTTTFSGTPPTAVAGQAVYTDTGTVTFTSLVTTAATECRCTKVSAEFTDFREEAKHHHYVLLFSLKWRLDCTAGSKDSCIGAVEVPHLERPLPHGLHLHYPPESGNVIPFTDGKGFLIHCHTHKRTCEDTTGEQEFELIGHHPQLRADLEMVFNIESRCIGGSDYEHKKTFTIRLDGQGKLDHRHSHLGTLS